MKIHYLLFYILNLSITVQKKIPAIIFIINSTLQQLHTFVLELQSLWKLSAKSDYNISPPSSFSNNVSNEIELDRGDEKCSKIDFINDTMLTCQIPVRVSAGRTKSREMCYPGVIPPILWCRNSRCEHHIKIQMKFSSTPSRPQQPSQFFPAFLPL